MLSSSSYTMTHIGKPDLECPTDRTACIFLPTSSPVCRQFVFHTEPDLAPDKSYLYVYSFLNISKKM